VSRLFESEWFRTRPPIVQELLRKHPPGQVLELGGEPIYVIGATEGGALLVSRTDPNVDYESAVAQQESICAACLDNLEHGKCPKCSGPISGDSR
jgi:hypothetical protein